MLKKKVKTKTVGTLLIAGLVVLSAMVVFATPAMAYTDEEFKNAPPIAELEPDDRYPSPPEGETREDPEWYDQLPMLTPEIQCQGLV